MRQPAHQHVGFFVGLPICATLHVGPPVLLEAPVVQINRCCKEPLMVGLKRGSFAAAYDKVVNLEE
ncbi:MAG: hypothetical protein HC822_27925 [Oscillochloris sp.]|nr:hypothetical protein [Oscillochloris sp.]